MKIYLIAVSKVIAFIAIMALIICCAWGPALLFASYGDWEWLLLYIVPILIAPLIMEAIFRIFEGYSLFEQIKLERENEEVEDMNCEYKFISIEDFARAIANAPWNTTFDFTFDTKEDIERNGEPEGWYGTKITEIFDEEDGVLCFGYQGGGCTQCVDMYAISDDTYDVPTNAKAIEKQLRKWFKDCPDGREDITEVCVEVTDDNYEYLMEV